MHRNIHPALSALRESYFEARDGRRRGGSGRNQIDFPAPAHACTVVLQAQNEGCTAVRTPGIRLLHPNR